MFAGEQDFAVLHSVVGADDDSDDLRTFVGWYVVGTTAVVVDTDHAVHIRRCDFTWVNVLHAREDGITGVFVWKPDFTVKRGDQWLSRSKSLDAADKSEDQFVYAACMGIGCVR